MVNSKVSFHSYKVPTLKHQKLVNGEEESVIDYRKDSKNYVRFTELHYQCSLNNCLYIVEVSQHKGHESDYRLLAQANAVIKMAYSYQESFTEDILNDFLSLCQKHSTGLGKFVSSVSKGFWKILTPDHYVDANFTIKNKKRGAKRPVKLKHRIEKVYVDIDGVLIDFVRGVKNLYGKSVYPIVWDIWESYDLSREDFFSRLDCDFWRELPPTYFAQELLKELVKLVGKENISLLTARKKFVTSDTIEEDTSYSIQKLATDLKLPLVFESRKYTLAKSNILLIDDNLQTVSDFRSNGGHAILCPQEYSLVPNKGYIEPFPYIKEQLDGYDFNIN